MKYSNVYQLVAILLIAKLNLFFSSLKRKIFNHVLYLPRAKSNHYLLYKIFFFKSYTGNVSIFHKFEHLSIVPFDNQYLI